MVTTSLGQSTAIEDGLSLDYTAQVPQSHKQEEASTEPPSLQFDAAHYPHVLPLHLRLSEDHDVAWRNADWECKRLARLMTDDQLDMWLYWLDNAAQTAKMLRAQRWAGRIDYRQPTMSVAERYEAQRNRTAAKLPKSDDLLAGLLGDEPEEETDDVLLEEL